MTDHDLERRLRQALHDDAASITPSDRRRAIEALAHEGATRSGRSRWLTPVAGAAAAAVVVTLAWGATEVLRPAPGGGTSPARASSRPGASTSSRRVRRRPARKGPTVPRCWRRRPGSSRRRVWGEAPRSPPRRG